MRMRGMHKVPGVEVFRRHGGGWLRGEVEGHPFQAQVFDEPSHFGADPANVRRRGFSRVSKLYIADGAYSFDRGIVNWTREGIRLAGLVLAAFPNPGCTGAPVRFDNGHAFVAGIVVRDHGDGTVDCATDARHKDVPALCYRHPYEDVRVA